MSVMFARLWSGRAAPERRTGLKGALGVSQQYGIVLWRDPRRAWLLMWAYFLLSLAVSPIIYLYIGPAGVSPMSAGHWYDWIFSAFFAWRVARGGRVSRMLLIIGAGAGYLDASSRIAYQFTPELVGHLAIYAAQIALLLSPAVYLRTRPKGWVVEPPLRTRVRPPLALLLLGILIGLGAALFRLHWLIDSQAALVINWAALARDWVQYAVISASVMYGCWLGTWARGKPVIGERNPSAARGRRRSPLPPAALALVAALGLVSLAVCSVAIIGRVDGYESATVHLRSGHPVRVTLSAGQYGVFVGCVDYFGCGPLHPSGLSVRGAGSDVAASAYDGFDQRGPDSQQGNRQFQRALTLTIPAQEHVQIDLTAKLRQLVFLAPSEEEPGVVRSWLAAAIVSVTALLGAVAGAGWLARRS
jgi:hypothetical protein